MANPEDATTLPQLEAMFEATVGSPMRIEPGVLHYVNLLVAAGVRTASSCEGHDGGKPWVLIDGTSATDEEIMALLKAAKLDDGVTIERGSKYPGLEFEYFEKRIIFPRRHPALNCMEVRHEM